MTKTRLDRSRRLRREQTDVERTLWEALRGNRLATCKFRRQHPIGPYICDFVCLEARLVIELDGSQHGEDAAMAYDARRSDFLADEGFRVLRFWNSEVNDNLDGVLEAIRAGVRPAGAGPT